MTGISGASENQAKKQTKNASQLMWKARMAGVEKENTCRRVALLAPEFSLRLSMAGGLSSGQSTGQRAGAGRSERCARAQLEKVHQRHDQHLRLGWHEVRAHAVGLHYIARGRAVHRDHHALAQRVDELACELEPSRDLVQVQELNLTAHDQRLHGTADNHSHERLRLRGILRGAALYERDFSQFRALGTESKRRSVVRLTVEAQHAFTAQLELLERPHETVGGERRRSFGLGMQAEAAQTCGCFGTPSDDGQRSQRADQLTATTELVRASEQRGHRATRHEQRDLVAMRSELVDQTTNLLQLEVQS